MTCRLFVSIKFIVVSGSHQCHALPDRIFAVNLIQPSLTRFLHLNGLPLFPFRVLVCVFVVQSHAPLRVHSIVSGCYFLTVRGKTHMPFRRRHWGFNKLFVRFLDIIIFRNFFRCIKGVSISMADIIVKMSYSFKRVMKLHIFLWLFLFFDVSAMLMI